MLPFATYRLYDMNPIGLASVFAVLVVLVFFGLASPLVHDASTRRRYAMAATLVLILLSVSEVFLAELSRTVSTSFGGGLGILVVAGFFFALHNLGIESKSNRVVGVVGALYFGAAYIFLIVVWGTSSWTTALIAVCVFIFAWAVILLLYLRVFRRRSSANTDRPEAGPYQFTLRGMFVVMLALGLFLSLYGVMHEHMETSNLRMRRSYTALEEWPYSAFKYLIVMIGGPPGNRGDSFAWYLGEDVVSYLESASLDFDDVDSAEALVLWLSAEELISGKHGRSSGSTPDWWAYLEYWAIEPRQYQLIDRDDDGWPELTSDTRAFGPVVFAVENGELVGWEKELDPTTGRRKGYVLRDFRRDDFKVIEEPPER